MPSLRTLVPTDVGRRLTSPQLSRRALLAGFGLAASGALVGCGQRGFASSVAPNGQLEKNLNIYSFADYNDPDNLKQFGSDRDLVVQVDNFGSPAELMAKLGATRGTSGYDLVVVTSTYLDLFIEKQLIQPLDLSLIPNLTNLEPKFQELAVKDGESYAVLKNYGTSGFLYDTTKITRELNSWEDFFDAAQNEASGAFSLLEDPQEVAAIGLAARNYPLNTTDPQRVQEVSDYLVDTIAPHVRAFNSLPIDLIVQGSMSMLQVWNGDARNGILKGDPSKAERWRFVYPSPYSHRWTDTWAIPVGVQHPDAAHAFINFLLEPDIALSELDYVGYPTGQNGEQEQADTEEFEYPEMLFPTEEYLELSQEMQINSVTETWVDMLGKMQAKAGA